MQPAPNLAALFQASALAYADRTALWVDDVRYRYGELYEHARAIASALPETPRRTAVLADRQYWSYAGIVGAVLAGHAYVPLNPRHPLDRLHTVITSAEIGALVLERGALDHYRTLLEALPPCRIVVPDATGVPNWALKLDVCFPQKKGAAPAATILPEDGAYLLFTSGSTGVPKGVMVSHANAMAYLNTVIERYSLSPDDRASQLFDLTFDLSVHDMFACWGSGGTLYCPSESARRMPQQFVRRHELTCWFSTPSTIALLSRLRMLRPNDFPTLRISLFCGEPLPKRLVSEWLKAAPNSLVENLYGPTEATIAITAFRVPRDVTDLPDILPIGTALPGQIAEVMDTGADDGELALSGSQVTAGYWRQEALTRERFVLHGGRRWYLTGDRARFDGANLRFLGRIDRQVKISGHRVELLEVESVLRQAAGCDSVAALAWPVDSDGLAQGIVAVVAAESHPDARIIATCRQMLAPYMVPARVMRLPDWPLNTNGKTDYTLLHTLVGGRP